MAVTSANTASSPRAALHACGQYQTSPQHWQAVRHEVHRKMALSMVLVGGWVSRGLDVLR
jgi:hypothetical protein